jgi:hypothetical protein
VSDSYFVCLLICGEEYGASFRLLSELKPRLNFSMSQTSRLTIGDSNNFSKSLRWIRMEKISCDRDSCEYGRNTRNNSRYPHNRAEFEHQAPLTANFVFSPFVLYRGSLTLQQDRADDHCYLADSFSHLIDEIPLSPTVSCSCGSSQTPPPQRTTILRIKTMLIYAISLPIY